MNKPISAALISVAGTMLSDGERKLIGQYRPLGVSLFARNIENHYQLAELTRQIREAAEDENIIIAVDQEGGRVRRLAEPEFRPYASQYVLGKSVKLTARKKRKSSIRTCAPDKQRPERLRYQHEFCTGARPGF